MNPIAYYEYPADIPTLELSAALRALEQAAEEHEPILQLDRNRTMYHLLKVARKTVLRLVFVDDQEVLTLEGLRPFVSEVRQAIPPYHFDFIEIWRNDVLWLVDPEQLTWVNETEKYIEASTRQRRELSPRDQAVIARLNRAGGQD